MAACTHGIGTADTGATPNTSGAFTPALNDLLVVFVVASATVQATATLTNSAGLTFTQFLRATYATSANSIYGFVSDGLVSSATSQTVTFDTAADAATGTVIFVCAVAGMSRTGMDAVRQSAKQDNGAAAGTPAPAFAASCLTGNPTLGCVGNNSSPAGLTPPTSWTEPASTGDLGYSTPTTGGEYVFRDSGFTGTTVTWGGTSATVFGALIVELDVTAAALVVLRSSSQLDAGTDSSAAVPVPSGVAADDIIQVDLWVETDNAVTAPAGFTVKATMEKNGGEDHRHYTYWKRATGADSGTYSFTWTGAVWRCALARRVSGCKTSGDPYNTFDAEVSAGTGTDIAPATSITTTVADCLALWDATSYNGSGWTAPTGYSNLHQDANFNIAGAAKTLGAAGTESVTTGNSGVASGMTAFLGALEPPGGAGIAIPILTRQFRQRMS